MVIKVSDRGRVPPFIVMDVMQAANALELTGRDVIHLEVGQPSTGLPRNAVEAVQKLIGREALGYTVANGISELRGRIATHYQQTYGVEIDPESIFITTGSSAGFQLAFLSAFNAGDRVALASPGYPAYRHIMTSLGLEPVFLDVGDETRFQPTALMLDELAQPIDGLIIASPSNPTGTIIATDEFESLIKVCRNNGIRLISDEIYHGISFGRKLATAAGRNGPEIVLNSFSKYFSMTGWRIGWMVVPPDLRRSVECLAQNHYISPPTISQRAAVKAFECKEELESHVARYRQNRDVLMRYLVNAGIENIAPADGAFYLYADVSHIAEDSVGFCKTLLENTGVAVTPGIDFDASKGYQTVRFSLAGSTDSIEEAGKRVESWIRQSAL